MGQLFESPQRLRRLAGRALRLGRRTDVYVGCAPRTRRHGGRDAVARAFVLWADCDGDDAVDALERFEPQPSVVIASGSGRNCHAYWPLTEPLAAGEIERGNRRLAHALGADPASADAARILRVPATYSHKHEPPVPVEALRLDVDRRMPAADVVGGLADPPRAPHTSAAAPAPSGAMTRCWRSRPTSTCTGCSASRSRAIARCAARSIRIGMQACTSTRPPSAAGTASGAAGAAARSTTSPGRCTATRRAARTSCDYGPSCAGCSDSRRRHDRVAASARLRLRAQRHPARDDDPRVARAARGEPAGIGPAAAPGLRHRCACGGRRRVARGGARPRPAKDRARSRAWRPASGTAPRGAPEPRNPSMSTGSVYLLHFEPGLPVTGNRVARHYLGFAEHDVQARVTQHLRRQGSPLVAAVLARRRSRDAGARLDRRCPWLRAAPEAPARDAGGCARAAPAKA